MQLNELIHISGSQYNKIDLLYEGDNIYSIHHTKPNNEEIIITLTREELFDIATKVFPNLG